MALVVNQFTPALWYGDAISNHVLAMRSALVNAGYSSSIYAEYIHERQIRNAQHYTKYKGKRGNILIYHLSIGSPIAEYIRYLPDTRVIVYHNITPSRYFEGYNAHAVAMTRRGRQEMRMLLPNTALALADSTYNETELLSVGYTKTGVLPIILDIHKLRSQGNSRLYGKYRDHWTNILFVGRLSPNKCQIDVVKAFYFYKRMFNPESRLFLVGEKSGYEAYERKIQNLAQDLRLNDIHIIGASSAADLATYYRLADLFLSMSEHEGFHVPLLESMHFGVPVLAYASTAVPETLGAGGILFSRKDYFYVAALMNHIIANTSLRKTLGDCQRAEVKRFEPRELKRMLIDSIARIRKQTR